MAMKEKYTVFDGEIVSHVRNGIRRDLVSTPDGSIYATITSTPTTGAVYTYWPFGNPRSTSGDANNSTPFRYKGAYGYYFEASNRHYVRARYMNGTYGRWYTQDPLWPREMAYGYVSNNPMTVSDPSGLTPYDRGTKSPTCPRYSHGKFRGTTIGTIEVARLSSIARAAYFIATGGGLKGYPLASDFLFHYLDKTGTTKTLDVAKFIHQDTSALKAYKSELNAAIAFAKNECAKCDKSAIMRFSIISTECENYLAKNRDYYYALADYRVWGSGTVQCVNARLDTLNFTFNVEDIYSFHKKGKFFTIAADDLGKLHDVGFAQEFISTGSHTTYHSF